MHTKPKSKLSEAQMFLTILQLLNWSRNCPTFAKSESQKLPICTSLTSHYSKFTSSVSFFVDKVVPKNHVYNISLQAPNLCSCGFRSWRTTSYRLVVTVYSKPLQSTSTFSGCFLHPHPDDVPCLGRIRMDMTLTGQVYNEFAFETHT
jgi:hypothetical protein